MSFDLARTEVPGTFENDLWRFRERAPKRYQGLRGFLINPGGIQQAASVYYPGGYYFALLLVSVFLGAMILPTSIFGLDGFVSIYRRLGSEPWVLAALVLTACMVAGMATYSFFAAREGKRALDAATAYLAHLKDRGIRIQMEFTQEREAYDAERTGGSAHRL